MGVAGPLPGPPSTSRSVYGGARDCGWGALFLPRHHNGSIFHELTVTLGELTGRVSHCCDDSFMLQRWNKLKNTAEQLHSLSSANTKPIFISFIYKSLALLGLICGLYNHIHSCRALS